MNHAAGKRSTVAPEIKVRAIYILNREAEIGHILIFQNLNLLQDVHQRFTVIPGRLLAAIHHVVAIQSGDRHVVHIFQTKL